MNNLAEKQANMRKKSRSLVVRQKGWGLPTPHAYLNVKTEEVTDWKVITPLQAHRINGRGDKGPMLWVPVSKLPDSGESPERVNAMLALVERNWVPEERSLTPSSMGSESYHRCCNYHAPNRWARGLTNNMPCSEMVDTEEHLVRPGTT